MITYHISKIDKNIVQLLEFELTKKKYEIENFLRTNHGSIDSRYLSKLRSFALSEGGLVNGKILIPLHLSH